MQLGNSVRGFEAGPLGSHSHTTFPLSHSERGLILLLVLIRSVGHLYAQINTVHPHNGATMMMCHGFLCSPELVKIHHIM